MTRCVIGWYRRSGKHELAGTAPIVDGASDVVCRDEPDGDLAVGSHEKPPASS